VDLISIEELILMILSIDTWMFNSANFGLVFSVLKKSESEKGVS